MLKALTSAPAPVTMLVLSFLCPTELSLNLAGLRLPPHRIALLLLVPLALFRVATLTDLRVRAFDTLFLLYDVWTLAVFVYHGEESGGLVFGGSLALESFGGYAVARVWIRDLGSFIATLRLLLLAIGFAALLALPETVLGQHFAHDVLQAVTGYDHPRALETRLGLTRAYGPFDHPIHLGTFCASLLAVFWFAERARPRPGRTALIAVGAFSAISSAPLLCLALQGMLIGWERITRGLPQRVALTAAIAASLYAGALLVATRSPIAVFATDLTLDPWTGYYRTLIWEHGLANVWAHPWTGLGLGDWERPTWMASASVDAFWLLTAMRGGLPAIALLLLAIVLLAGSTAHRGSRHRDPFVRRLTMGWTMSLIALALLACTVHYWNVLYAYFFFFLGLAGWIADPVRLKASVAQRRSAGRAHRPARRPVVSGGQAVATGGGVYQHCRLG